MWVNSFETMSPAQAGRKLAASRSYATASDGRLTYSASPPLTHNPFPPCLPPMPFSFFLTFASLRRSAYSLGCWPSAVDCCQRCRRPVMHLD